MSESTRHLMERYFAAWNAHDIDGLRTSLAQHFVVHACHPTDVGGTYEGLEAFLEWHDRKRELAGPAYAFRLHDLLIGERHAVALFKLASARDGRLYEWHQTAVYHVDGGLITEAWVHQEPIREVTDGAAAVADTTGWVIPPLR